MPRTPSPLPPTLPTVFTLEDLRAYGLPPSRARRADVLRLDHGLHLRRDVPVRCWAALGLPEPAHGLDPDRVAALLRERPGTVLSHESAAHVHGLPLPWVPWRPAPREDVPEPDRPPLHVTVPSATRRVRRTGVRDHRRDLGATAVGVRHGLAVTTLERTWLDLCALGHPWTLERLVAAGDHAVNRPWTPEGRLPARTTVARLRAALHEVGRFKGVVRARAALEMVRVGADSPRETEVRLALVDAGLPEPELQVPIDPRDPFSPVADLGYRGARLALQYDGEHHRTAEQQARDVRRDRYGRERDWTTLRITADDAKDDYRRVIAQVRDHLTRHGLL